MNENASYYYTRNYAHGQLHARCVGLVCGVLFDCLSQFYFLIRSQTVDRVSKRFVSLQSHSHFEFESVYTP